MISSGMKPQTFSFENHRFLEITMRCLKIEIIPAVLHANDFSDELQQKREGGNDMEERRKQRRT